jgi:hypothetical protein
MSLGSRGKRSRDGWRLAAAKTMTELVFDRFIVCKGIILSLFLRRQNAIANLDNKTRKALHKLRGSDLWPPSIHDVSDPDIKNVLNKILDWKICAAQTYGHPFRFLPTRSLYNKVSINFQVFLNNAVSYRDHLQNRGLNGQLYAWWIHWFGIKVCETFKSFGVQ